MSRQEPLLQTAARQCIDKESAAAAAAAAATAGNGRPGRELQSYFHPERAFVEPGPRAWPYRIPSFSLPIPPKPEGKVILPCSNNIYLLPLLRGSQKASLAFLDKTADSPCDIGAVISSPGTPVLRVKADGSRETAATWQRAEGRGCLLPPEHHPSQVCLDAMTSWGLGRAQTAQQESGSPVRESQADRNKWRAGQNLWRPAGETQPRLGDRAGTYEDSGQGGTPPPGGICSWAKDLGRAQSGIGHQEGRQETGLLGPR